MLILIVHLWLYDLYWVVLLHYIINNLLILNTNRLLLCASLATLLHLSFELIIFISLANKFQWNKFRMRLAFAHAYL
jgi:hypothetical protein